MWHFGNDGGVLGKTTAGAWNDNSTLARYDDDTRGIQQCMVYFTLDAWVGVCSVPVSIIVLSIIVL